MAELLLFLGDIKGTKSALACFGGEGRSTLEQRIERLQDDFAASFRAYKPRSRSLVGVTLSDSVLAYWTDAVEGKRFALDFMLTLWRRLHPTQLRFRGFLDIGECVDETSVISHVLSATDPSFLKLLPSGLAAWSVTVAEASHFPDGLFVSERLSTEMRGDLFEAGTFHAGPFQYRKVRVAGQTAVSAPTGLIR